MRIMQVNWGWPPRQSGGPIGYAADLSRELVRRGHQVSVFYAGDYDFGGTCHLSLGKESGIRLGSLVNSPNLIANFGSPMKECRHPIVEDAFLQFLEINRPEVVHFHSLIGLCGSLLEVAKGLNVSTVVSLHNYWFICPRSDFLRHSESDYALCPGPEAEHHCAACIIPLDPTAHRKVLMRHRLKCLIKRSGHIKRFIQKRQMDFFRRAHRYLRIRENTPRWPANRQPSWEEIVGYRYREKFLKDQLLENADLIIAVSRAVKQRFAEHGIPKRKIKVLHSGIKQAEALESFARRSRARVGSPLTFAFFGPVLPYKGVHVLIDAFNRLPTGSARLLIFGTGDARYILRLMKKANRFVEFKGAFRNLTQIFPHFDVAVVPPIWHDNAPLVVLEALAARKPIIGARIGGIPDFVTDGNNGFLFEAGDAADLAGKMRSLIDSPESVERLKENIRTPKSMSQHAAELERVYRELSTPKPATEPEVSYVAV